jgi:hypothetical protein
MQILKPVFDQVVAAIRMNLSSSAVLEVLEARTVAAKHPNGWPPVFLTELSNLSVK